MHADKILVYGSTVITAAVVRELMKHGFHVVGHVPSTRPILPGKMTVRRAATDEPCDIAISIQYDRRLPVDGKTFNLHTGLLPEYGGSDILYHTLKNKEREQGLTFHLISDVMDGGPRFAKTTYPVFEGDTVVTLYRRIIDIAPQFVLGCVRLLERVDTRMVANLPAGPPTKYYKRGDIDPADAAGYAQTLADLRETFL